MSREYRPDIRENDPVFLLRNAQELLPPLTRESFRVLNVIKYHRDACTSLGNGEKCVTFNFFFRNNFYL
jgi:hypothetical protein